MEDDQQFYLRWNNHQSTLIQNFDTLLESGTLVDCTLVAEGKTLKAHKVVLSACSPYFECLVREHYDKHPVFILKDVKFKELKAMMDYMYRGEVNISQDQLAALLKAAESLHIKGRSESKTACSSKTESRPQKTVSHPRARVSPSLDILHASSGLTIEKNKVPRQSVAQGPVGDLPEETASTQGLKRLCSREDSQSPTSRKRNRFRRRSLGEDNNTLEMQDASNSSDMPQQMGVPALGIAPVTDEKVHANSIDSLGRSALMTPADEILQPLETNDNLIESKSEYLEESKECVEDLMLDDDMNDLNDVEQDNNQAGPSQDPAQQAQRDSQGFDQSTIHNHRLIIKKKKFKCPRPNCSNEYCHKSSLDRHQRYVCEQKPRFKCPYCQRCTTDRSVIYRHVRQKHKRRKVFSIDTDLKIRSYPYRKTMRF